MSQKQVVADLPANSIPVFCQCRQIGLAKLRRNLIADMEELAKVAVIVRATLVVADGPGQAVVRPGCYGIGGAAGRFCRYRLRWRKVGIEPRSGCNLPHKFP